ncbi:factor H binding protein domain-containing protein, partial [Spirabiliibacterium falconis]|uniref:factor H binding protein domain-containing protein n=1 Tax=Spirabiliibacterium falconis TaxID=572023 RepID=UPI001AACE4B7
EARKAEEARLAANKIKLFENAQKAGLSEEDAKAYSDNYFHEDDYVAIEALNQKVRALSVDTYTRKDTSFRNSDSSAFQYLWLETDNSGMHTSGSSESSIINGRYKQMSYEVYSYNSSESAHGISTAAGNLGRDSLIAYSGNPTKSHVIEKLKGEATYSGKAFVSNNYRVDTNGQVTLKANFTEKTVSGNIASDIEDITLSNTNINLDNGVMEFKGNANATGKRFGVQYTGEYEGKFMGVKAEQVAGVAKLADSSDLNVLGSSFSGTK